MSEEMLLAFDSTQQALRAEMLLEYVELDIDICPTPKEVTAGCALSIAFHSDDLNTVKQVIKEEQVEIRGIFVKNDEKYVRMEES